MEKTRSLPSQEGSPALDNLSDAQIEKFLDEALFAMTVYRLPIGDCKAWTSLQAAMSHSGVSARLFIYDNSPAVQDPPQSLHLRSHYQHDGTNRGISTAYNAAYRFAKNEGRKWLLFLDQDTRLEAGALAHYIASVNANPSCSLFAPVVSDSQGMLSPFRFGSGRGVRVASFPSRLLSLHEFRAINAGLLVSCDLFEKVGGYEEDIPLDFSDIAFLEKVNLHGDLLCLTDASLEQEFSGSTPLNFASSLERFKKYNEGAMRFTRHFGRTSAIRWGTFIRAMKLTLHFGRLEFLRNHFKTWSE